MQLRRSGGKTCIWKAGRLILVILTLSALAKAEEFEPTELFGTAWGLTEMVGSGTMEPDFAYQGSHGAIQVADIDGDTYPDVVVLADASDVGIPSKNVTQGPLGDPAGFSFVGSDLFWYQNDGFGNFFPQPVTIEIGGVESPATIFNGKNLEVADLDRDGDDDIVVWCNYYDQSLFAQGQGAGKVAWFENRRLNGGGPGEFFPDGRPKFVQHTVVDFLETFTVDGYTFETGNPRGGTLADLDQDGWLDLLVLNYSGGSLADRSSLFWFKNSHLGGAAMFSRDPGGHILPVIIAGGVDHPYREPNGIVVSARDIDGDGDMDLVLGENESANKELTLLRNVGGGRFSKQVIKSDFRISQSLSVDNLFVFSAGNPCQEIIAGGKDTGWNSPLSVFYADDAGCTNWNQAILQNTSDMNHIWKVRTGDFNNDGRADIVALWANDGGNPATLLPNGRRSMCRVWVNDGTSNPSTWPTIDLGEKGIPPGMETENNGGLALADFDKDGDIDVVRSHVETNLVYFENTWNTERLFKIETIANKNASKQKVTSFLSTNPNRSVGRVIGQKVENQ